MTQFKVSDKLKGVKSLSVKTGDKTKDGKEITKRVVLKAGAVIDSDDVSEEMEDAYGEHLLELDKDGEVVQKKATRKGTAGKKADEEKKEPAK